jgi:hypothetical protein
MTMVIPAITAKATKRLPLMPHCGRKSRGNAIFPMFSLNAMAFARPQLRGELAASIALPG